jgi:hypothetical protein
MDTEQKGRSDRFTTNYNTYNEQSLNKCQVDSPTDIVVDAVQSENISLDSPTDIVVDTAQSEREIFSL